MEPRPQWQGAWETLPPPPLVLRVTWVPGGIKYKTIPEGPSCRTSEVEFTVKSYKTPEKVVLPEQESGTAKAEGTAV